MLDKIQRLRKAGPLPHERRCFALSKLWILLNVIMICSRGGWCVFFHFVQLINLLNIILFSCVCILLKRILNENGEMLGLLNKFRLFVKYVNSFYNIIQPQKYEAIFLHWLVMVYWKSLSIYEVKNLSSDFLVGTTQSCDFPLSHGKAAGDSCGYPLPF